ncbi:MAG TPA: RNA polymerase sporulation sigma factor, SigF/SigG family [Candidatus Egerieimonas intestinavium]|uniref:RNA polymerase sigma factor n=1 Tax=Candidatus Egerieimonas intestinavium TaxID=2840777 RepID=A0A9D1JEZ9_9FIRM|nr:RNA polymerase sporulation sigma factor, SigF/SigG family [Candidatus Egerieimonas intestinavium]
MDHTLSLIQRAHQGDKEARDTLIEENMGLVYSVARRFLGRGVDQEDLFQIGSIGLIKAVDKFDPAFQVRFSTYAVPMITGEIKRFLRDDGMLKVSRSLKETACKAYQAREELERSLGREPTLAEIAQALEADREELILALESGAEVESLQQTIFQGDGSSIQLEDKLEAEGDSQEELLNRVLLEEILGVLPGQERALLYQRFFQERTQAEIARELGISQVQVSRMEKRILKQLRQRL